MISDKLLGTSEWFVIHHTRSRMEFFTNDVIRGPPPEQPRDGRARSGRLPRRRQRPRLVRRRRHRLADDRGPDRQRHRRRPSASGPTRSSRPASRSTGSSTTSARGASSRSRTRAQQVWPRSAPGPRSPADRRPRAPTPARSGRAATVQRCRSSLRSARRPSRTSRSSGTCCSKPPSSRTTNAPHGAALRSRQPSSSGYLDGWGRRGDAGFVAQDVDGIPLGAAWYPPVRGVRPRQRHPRAPGRPGAVDRGRARTPWPPRRSRAARRS